MKKRFNLQLFEDGGGAGSNGQGGNAGNGGSGQGFTPLQTYKVLKPVADKSGFLCV